MNNKIKKSDSLLSLTLEKTKDILAEMSLIKKEGQFMVGFALETDNEIDNATTKLKNKNLDLIVMNSLKKAGEFLDQLEANIEDSGWIAGDKFSMADACTLPYILRLDHLALSEAFSKEKRPKINNWYKEVRDLDFFDKAVTSQIPPPLVEMMNTFGEEVKEKALNLMEEK